MESLQIHVDRVRQVDEDVLVLATFEAHAREGMSVKREVAWVWHFVDDLAGHVDAYGTWDEALEAAGLRE